MTHPADLDPTTREQIMGRLRARPALWRRYVEEAAGTDESFALWLFTLDATLSRRTGGLPTTTCPTSPGSTSTTPGPTPSPTPGTSWPPN